VIEYLVGYLEWNNLRIYSQVTENNFVLFQSQCILMKEHRVVLHERS
jgi:hypothetical protein